MSVLKDTLLDYCSSCSGEEIGPDEWDEIEEKPNFCSCYYELTCFQGMIFPLDDIIKYVTWKKPVYSFRDRMGYKKIRDMNPYEKLDFLEEYCDRCRYDCSPFGCGSDESWDYEVEVIDGIPYFMTYSYVGL